MDREEIGSSLLDTEEFGPQNSSRQQIVKKQKLQKGQDTLRTVMSTDNNTGIQTRAMAQRTENDTDAEQLQRPPSPDMNPTVELHRSKEEAIKEFV